MKLVRNIINLSPNKKPECIPVRLILRTKHTRIQGALWTCPFATGEEPEPTTSYRLHRKGYHRQSFADSQSIKAIVTSSYFWPRTLPFN